MTLFRTSAVPADPGSSSCSANSVGENAEPPPSRACTSISSRARKPLLHDRRDSPPVVDRHKAGPSTTDDHNAPFLFALSLKGARNPTRVQCAPPRDANGLKRLIPSG